MNKLLRIASILDKSGQFHLSDKLFQVAQYNSEIDNIPIEMQIRRMQELNYSRRQELDELKEAYEKFIRKEINEQQYKAIEDKIKNSQTSKDLDKIYDSQMYQRYFPKQQANKNQAYPLNMPKNLTNTRVMDGSRYLNNPYTPREIMDIRRQLVPNNFRGQMYQDLRNDSLMKTTDLKSFSIGLTEYARMNNFPNLQVAFDNYSNDGATYNGQNIQTIPELQELYSRISRTSDIITPEMIENELRSIINQRR